MCDTATFRLIGSGQLPPFYFEVQKVREGESKLQLFISRCYKYSSEPNDDEVELKWSGYDILEYFEESLQSGK